VPAIYKSILSSLICLVVILLRVLLAEGLVIIGRLSLVNVSLLGGFESIVIKELPRHWRLILKLSG
jgi:hypothetical protein